jgi:hypothetical protein
MNTKKNNTKMTLKVFLKAKQDFQSVRCLKRNQLKTPTHSKCQTHTSTVSFAKSKFQKDKPELIAALARK